MRHGAGELMVLRTDGRVCRATLVCRHGEKACRIEMAVTEPHSRPVVAILGTN